MDASSMSAVLQQLGPQQTAGWGNTIEIADAGVLPYNALASTQNLGHARNSLLPSTSQKSHDFLHSIYLLRNSFHQSINPPSAEIVRLAQETTLAEYQISSWFDGERKQREFWISQNSLPTPQTTQTFEFGNFDQYLTSESSTLVSRMPITSYPTDYTTTPGTSMQATIESRVSESSPVFHPHSNRRGYNMSVNQGLLSQAVERKRRRLRPPESTSQDDIVENGNFACPTCFKRSKNAADWTSHQARSHFPRTIWICGGTDGKPCKAPPLKRKDNFRKHLVTAHRFQMRSEELEAEVRKRAIAVTGLFHEKCGFCRKELSSWDSSMQHIWEHIERGDDTRQWIHACKSKDHELKVGVHYKKPSENSQSDGPGFEKDNHNDDDPNSSGGGHGDSSHFGPSSNFDNFFFGPGFDGGFGDGGSGSGHSHDTEAPQNYQYRIWYSNLKIQNISLSMHQSQTAERPPASRHVTFMRTLGSGGFGRVDEVRCNETQARFALKVLRRRAPGMNASPEATAFINEVAVLKYLVHPHVIQFLGCRIFGNAFCILMQPVAEGNLATYLQEIDSRIQKSFSAVSKSKSSPDLLWTLMGCLASAVSYIHSVNIVHGDLKPENVLIAGSRIVLTDFGSAKKLSNDNQALEAICTLSPEFSAPEAIMSGRKDSAGDIWSFGCILTLVATYSVGRHSDDFDRFRFSDGDKKSFYASLPKVLEWLAMLGTQQQVSQLSVPDGPTLFRMIRRMLSEEPDARPRAQEVWNLLPKNRSCQCDSELGQLVPESSNGMNEARFVDPEAALDSLAPSLPRATIDAVSVTTINSNLLPPTNTMSSISVVPMSRTEHKEPAGRIRYWTEDLDLVYDRIRMSKELTEALSRLNVPLKRLSSVYENESEDEESETELSSNDLARLALHEVPRFACPFRKHDPSRYNVNTYQLCALTSFANIARLKEHLYRKHRTYNCSICLRPFANQEELDAHNGTADPMICAFLKLPSTDATPGISILQETQLRSKKKAPGDTIEDRWRSIYGILFPAEETPSPYFEAVTEDGLLPALHMRDREHPESCLRPELPCVVSSGPEETTVQGSHPVKAAPNNKYDWDPHLPKMKHLYRTGMSIPNICKEIQDKRTHFTPGLSMVYNKFRTIGYPTERHGRTEFLEALEPSKESSMGADRLIDHQDKVVQQDQASSRMGELLKNSDDHTHTDREENLVTTAFPGFTSLRENTLSQQDESSHAVQPLKPRFPSVSIPWATKSDASCADSSALDRFPNPRRSFAPSVMSIDSGYAPSERGSLYDNDQKYNKSSRLLVGSRHSTSAFSIRSADSGYASSRLSLAPSSRNSSRRALLWPQQEKHPDPDPQSSSEFNSLFRVPCHTLHEPQPRSWEQFRDMPTCHYCEFSGTHGLSWSAMYLSPNVFMAEVILPLSEPHVLDAAGNSALHYAAAGGASFQHFTALINAGANPDQLNTAGQLFLHCLQPKLSEIGSEGYDNELVSLFKADLVNLLNNFHSKGAFRWRDNEGNTPMDALGLQIGDLTVKMDILRMVKDAGYPLDIFNRFDARSINYKPSDHQPRVLLKPLSTNTILPTKEQALNLTDDQCRKIQDIVDPDGLRSSREWEWENQPELIRLYMTMMSFPAMEAALKGRLTWSYKTYSNKFREWFFPVDRMQREKKIIEVYGLVSESTTRNTSIAPRPLSLLPNISVPLSAYPALQPPPRAILPKLGLDAGGIAANRNDFALNQLRQDTAWEILGRAHIDHPSYVDPATGDNVFHALARIHLADSSYLLSKIQDFVSKDVDLNRLNRDKYSPLVAFITERPVLEKHGQESGAVFSKYLDALLWKDPQRRIPNKINVNLRNREGATALYYAAVRGRPDSVRSLIEAGANVNVRIDVDGHKISILQATMNAKAKAVMQKDIVQVIQFDNVISYLEHNHAVEDPTAVEERRVFEGMIKVMPV